MQHSENSIGWLRRNERQARGQQKWLKKLLCMQSAGVMGMAEGVEEVLGGVESKDEVGEVVQVLNHPCHS